MTAILLLQLPQDILTTVFKQLNLQDIHNLILTCKTLRNLIVNDNVLWKSITHRLQKSISYDSYDRPKRLILQNKRNEGFPKQSWYNNCRTSYNWCKGFFKTKVILQHRVNYMPWIKLHNSEALLITVGPQLHCYAGNGFLSCKNLLWKLEMPEILRNDIRTNDITRFILNDDLLVCGNRDGSTAVYKVDNIKIQPHLIQHISDCHNDGQVEVTAVELIRNDHDYYVVTTSNDSSNIQFWHQSRERECRDDYQQNLKSTHHMDITLDEDIGVRCLAVNEKISKLAIGPNGNNRPMFLDATTGQLIVTNYDTKNRKHTIRDIQWHNENLVVYVTHSGNLHLTDIRTNDVVYTAVDPFQSTLYCVKTDGDRAFIAGSSEYSRCVLFDFCTPLHVQMYFTQKRSSPVYSLDFNTSTLVTAVDRGVASLNFDVISATTHQRDHSDIFKYY